MTKLSLIVFILAVISTGYLQEITNKLFDHPPTNDNPSPPQWSLQNYQGARRKGKPCPRRSNNPNQPWIPSYSSRITHPLLDPLVLQPEALKNVKYNNIDTVLLPLSEEDRPAPERRVYESYINSVQSANDVDDDCVEQLNSTNGNAEETALKIIEDCLKKKQKSKDSNLLGTSRRSMFSVPDGAEDDEDTEGALFGNLPALSIERGGDDKKPEINRRKLVSENIPTATTVKSVEPEKGRADSPPSFGSTLQNLRICYACSTATNPSCWEPDKRTTIKYCTREQSCVTRTFGAKSSLTLIRDCANSCEDSSIPGLEPKYKSCDLCHSDYCNSAITITGYNLAIILIISIIKCTF